MHLVTNFTNPTNRFRLAMRGADASLGSCSISAGGTIERCTIADAALNFDGLVSRVADEGIVVEIERDNHVVARLSPATPSPLTVNDLSAFFAQLPSLGDDAQAFERGELKATEALERHPTRICRRPQSA